MDKKLRGYICSIIITYKDERFIPKKNAKVKYLKLIIEKDKRWKIKYSKLLEPDNQQKLNEIVLKHNTVQKILQTAKKSLLESECFNDFIVEVQNFLERTDNNVKQISKFCALCLISAFTRDTLTQSQVEQILNLVDENLKTEVDNPKNSIIMTDFFLSVFDVLKDSAPKKFIQYVIDCVDFEKCKNGTNNDYLFETVCHLIIHDPYSNNNFKQAIKNVLIDGVEYEEFRSKLSKVKGFGEYVTDRLKQNPEFDPVKQFKEKLSVENLTLCFENGKFELKKMESINVDAQKTEQKFNNTEKIVADASNDSDRKLLRLRLVYVILFIIAFVALLNVGLSFLAVPKIVSWIVFGFCFAGGSVCVFFACRIKNLKKSGEEKIKSVYSIAQNNKGKIIYLDLSQNSGIGNYFFLRPPNGFDNH